jgi:SAM-dependent methyltransferase
MLGFSEPVDWPQLGYCLACRSPDSSPTDGRRRTHPRIGEDLRNPSESNPKSAGSRLGIDNTWIRDVLREGKRNKKAGSNASNSVRDCEGTIEAGRRLRELTGLRRQHEAVISIRRPWQRTSLKPNFLAISFRPDCYNPAMANASVLRSVYHSLPPQGQMLARQARSIANESRDVVRSIFGQRLKRSIFGDMAAMVPPLYLMRDGTRDYAEFKQNGLDAFRRFLDFGLRPTDRILDIGSGIGRKTLPLLDFLAGGSYEGIDPVASQVRWCSERITPRYPNFRFQTIDVWGKHYNPKGTIKPSEYVFPFGDGEFDFVILGSVFTHMFSTDMQHYVDEIARVLKVGAKGLITFFLLNHESDLLIAEGKSTLRIVYQYENGSKACDPDGLETAIGHQETFVLEMFERRGLNTQIAERGSWCGRAADYYQDIIKITRQ